MQNFIKLSICIDNAAFGETCAEQAEEFAEILYSLARNVRANPEVLAFDPHGELLLKNIRDSNGNTVGSLMVSCC
jgi:hypothetical protein